MTLSRVGLVCVLDEPVFATYAMRINALLVAAVPDGGSDGNVYGVLLGLKDIFGVYAGHSAQAARGNRLTNTPDS